MSSPADVVADAFSIASQYADDAKTQMASFTNAFSNAIYQVPTIDITFAPIEASTALAAPTRPGALDDLESEFDWDQDGSIETSKPDALSLVAPDLTIDDFTESAPDITIPDAPSVSYGSIPTVPSVANVSVPSAPSLANISAPSLLSFSTPTFAGLDLPDTTALETAPSLTLASPTAYTYTPGAAYSSTLLTNMKSLLVTRLAGGTGLNSTVEQAIWDRARDREGVTAQANIDEILRTSEALGFHLPSGVTTQQTREAQQNYYDKAGGLSRDIAIKQADLEQENLKQTITMGVQLETQLIDYSWKLENLAYESAKTLAQNAVDIYNARVVKFRTDIEAYQAYASAIKVIVDAQLATVEELKAYIAIEQAKADSNKALVDQYRAQIEAQMASVRVFEVQVGAAKVLIELEQAKVMAAGEQIKAYVAGVNAETAKVEAFKAQVQGQQAIVEVYATKARAFAAKAGAQADAARAQVSYYEGRIRAFASEWDAWRARVQGETARFQALGAKADAVLGGYKADIAAFDASVGQDVKRWETQIKEYEATAQYTLAGQKLNVEVLQANRAALLEAAKVGAQTYAQLTSAAYGIFHASAAVSGSNTNAVSYAYTNNTGSAPASVTAV